MALSIILFCEVQGTSKGYPQKRGVMPYYSTSRICSSTLTFDAIKFDLRLPLPSYANLRWTLDRLSRQFRPVLPRLCTYSNSVLSLLRQHLSLLRMADRALPDQLLEADFAVDLPHALPICLGSALASK